MSDDFYKLVPKDLEKNLIFRKHLIKIARYGEGNRDPEQVQKELWMMCSRDILFYTNAFVWMYEPRPRKKKTKVLPFITYDFQDEGILRMNDAIDNQYDLYVEKTKCVGATWMLDDVFDWRARFKDLESFLLMSRKEELVDKKGSPGCLFWKLDFIDSHLPGFLRCPIDRTSLHKEFLSSKSVIDGESTNADAGRGDRRTAVGLDEAAHIENDSEVYEATADTSGCRISVSTHNGSNSVFYDRIKMGSNSIRLHWSQHPEYAAGLYTTVNNELKILDQKFVFPAGYPFILDGKIRSPFYDYECTRRSRQDIAQQLDIDPVGSGAQFFDQDTLNSHISLHARDPNFMGELIFNEFTMDAISITEIKSESSPLRLWFDASSFRNIDVKSRFVLSADISAGTGASNSCLSICERGSNEKVAEYVTPFMKPHDLAHVAIALGRVFNCAYMIWEANGGPGRNFGDEILKYNYPNVYFKTNEGSTMQKVTDHAGWYSSKEGKASLLGEYRNALKTCEMINHSYSALKECEQYVYGKGEISHAKESKIDDPSGAKSNHGDRVIADALCWKVLKEDKKKGSEAYEETIDPSSALAFMNRKQLEKANANSDTEVYAVSGWN